MGGKRGRESSTCNSKELRVPVHIFDSLNPTAGFRGSPSQPLLHFLCIISQEIGLHGFEELLRGKRKRKNEKRAVPNYRN